MSGVPYHGWTHAQKEQGGTDPTPSLVPTIHVAGFVSTTDWGTSYTTLDFTSWGYGPYVEFPVLVDGVESDFASIGFNSAANIVIAKHGVYSIDVMFSNYVNNANVSTVRWLEVKTIAGELPDGYGPAIWSSGHYAEVPTRIFDQPGNTVDVYPSWRPAYHDWMVLQPDAFDVGTLGETEIQIQAYKEEDEVGVAETQVVTRVWITRHGQVHQSLS